MRLLHGLLVAFAVASCTAPPADTPPAAELILTGAEIITMDSARPDAQAVAIRDGRIVGVGSAREMDAYRGPETVVRDLGGAVLAPGFIDAHGHLLNTGMLAVSANLMPPPDGGVGDIPHLQAVLEAYARGVPDAALVLGFGYDDSQLAEQRHPTRQELDAVVPDRPVAVLHQSGHLAVVNTALLKQLGWDATTPDPAGGVIRREADGYPNGVLEEAAVFRGLAPLAARTGLAETLAMLREGQALLVSYGFTTVQEGRAMPGQTGALIAAAEQGLLEVDVAVYPDIMAASQDIAAPWLSRTYRKHLRVAGAKLSLDGSPQGKTAWLTEPYFRAPAGLPADYRGYPAYSDAQVQAAVGRAYEQGWQLLVHVNGDAAIDQLIAAVRSARERFGAADRRTVAIHAQTVREDQLDAFKALGIMPSFYSMHTFYWGDWHRDSVLGPARAARISPAQSAIDRGMHFTSHHDAPVVMPNPARMLSSMVTRRARSGEVLGPEQRITPYAALRAITLDAAYQYFEEAEKGSISVGKLADLVLLSDNPLTMAPDTLASDLKVLETIKAGRTIYRAPAR